MDFSNGIALIQSRTFWAALLSLVAIVAQQFGLSGTLKWAANPATIDTILAIISAVGMVAAIGFRIVAKEPIVAVISAPK